MSRIPERVVAAVFARSGGRCEVRLPGCLGHPIIHHRLRVDDDPDLLVHACNDNCHNSSRGIHGNPDWAYRHGWLIRRNGIRRVFGPVTGCDLSCPIDHTPEETPDAA